MFVNDELEELKKGLQRAMDIVRPGGVVGIVSFHSLEDRVVKKMFRGDSVEYLKPDKNKQSRFRKMAARGLQVPIETRIDTGFEMVTKKVIIPSEEEIQDNPRSRSAKLRFYVKRVGND
jgi:16S rRNA (cytosine1402-N4)-methyltransferase